VGRTVPGPLHSWYANMSTGGLRPNMRMKLSWRGGRSKGNRSILMAAAAPRSLCAIR